MRKIISKFYKKRQAYRKKYRLDFNKREWFIFFLGSSIGSALIFEGMAKFMKIEQARIYSLILWVSVLIFFFLQHKEKKKNE